MERVLIPYSQGKVLVNEADVLLFRGSGWASYFLSRSGKSTYTHVAMASWINGRANTPDGILECVEFREGSPIAGLFNSNAAGSGRAVNLSREVNKYPGCIDVYRPIPYCTKWVFDEEKEDLKLERTFLVHKDVTDTMRKLTGLPYGWRRIWWLAKQSMAGFRLFTDVESLQDDESGDIIYPVCSTAVAYCFNKNGFDLINNKSDEWTEPGDVARSARLSYLFTLEP